MLKVMLNQRPHATPMRILFYRLNTLMHIWFTRQEHITIY